MLPAHMFISYKVKNGFEVMLISKIQQLGSIASHSLLVCDSAMHEYLNLQTFPSLTQMQYLLVYLGSVFYNSLKTNNRKVTGPKDATSKSVLLFHNSCWQG